MLDLGIILISLGLLMYTAYKGFSVILMAPVCALLAVFLISPSDVLPFYSGVFMPKMVAFIKDYFLVFLLGAIFGKVVEMSGIAESIAKTLVKLIGSKNAMFTVVLLCGLLTYSGVSLFVVVFAVFPFANQLFRQSNIPKRLIPGTIALGAFSFTMDALPGTPQIQNVIPTTFFGTNIYAAPFLGTIGAIFVLIVGLSYLEWRRRTAAKNGDGFATGVELTEAELKQLDMGESSQVNQTKLKKVLAFLPLILVAVTNKYFSISIQEWYPNGFDFSAIGLINYSVDVSKVSAIWAVGLALLVGIISSLFYDLKRVSLRFKEGINTSISGSLLAVMNTASEYGFGAVIAALPGFIIVSHALGNTFSNPLVNGAVTTTVLAGITGSASGGMSIALSAMADHYNIAIQQLGIPAEVMHRVVAMASGGMDTLPHNGAVITLLAVAGLTHKQSYKDIFAITVIKTIAVFFVIAVFLWTGII